MKPSLACLPLLLLLAACQSNQTTSLKVRPAATLSWTNIVTLEQLKHLPIPELVEHGGIGLKRDGDTNYVDVTTWADYTRLLDEGYYAVDNVSIRQSGWIASKRGFIPFFEKAVDSKKSYVSNLRPGRSLLKLLPPTLGMLTLREEVEAAEAAKRRGESWLDFYPDSKVTETGPDRMTVIADGFQFYFRIQGYGDYDHDGCEDLVAYCYLDAIEGSLGYGFNAHLTRTGPGQKLRSVPEAKEGAAVKEPEGERGYEYTCQAGDRLGNIVEAYRNQGVSVTVEDVVKANPGVAVENLKPGQKLFIPHQP